jgi:hypothetical protein
LRAEEAAEKVVAFVFRVGAWGFSPTKKAQIQWGFKPWGLFFLGHKAFSQNPLKARATLAWA